MHGSDRRIGERLSGQAGAQQHGLACLAVAAVVHRLVQIGRQEAQRLAGQQVGHGVLLQRAGVGLDGMHHGVDAGGRGHRWRQAEGEIGVEQRQVRQQQGRDHAHLGRLAGGDDGDLRDFRTGAGGGRHLNQRQALALGIADAIDVLQRLRAIRMGQQCHQLGHIHRAAAAKPDHQIGTARFRLLDGSHHDIFWRIGDDLIVNGDLQPFRLEARQYLIEQAETGDARISHDQHRACPALLAKAGQPARRARLADQLSGCGKAERMHRCLL